MVSPILLLDYDNRKVSSTSRFTIVISPTNHQIHKSPVMSSQPSLPTPGILQVPSKTQYDQDCREEEDIDEENPLISDIHITDSGENVEPVSLDITAGAGWCFPRKNPLRDMFCDFQRVFPTETQKVFLKEKSKKHIMCFFQVSHR